MILNRLTKQCASVLVSLLLVHLFMDKNTLFPLRKNITERWLVMQSPRGENVVPHSGEDTKWPQELNSIFLTPDEMDNASDDEDEKPQAQTKLVKKKHIESMSAKLTPVDTDNAPDVKPNSLANPVKPLEKKHVESISLVEGKPWLTRTRPDFQEISRGCRPEKSCGLNSNATARSRIIDYAVLGFAKCGSTTVGHALGKFSQAPTGDTCVNVRAAIKSSYKGWPKQYGSIPARNNQNIMTGLKCPAGLEMGSIIRAWGEYQPDTLLIAGIRHPVLAFQSFYNMFVQNGFNLRDPYQVLPSCKSKATCSERGCPGKGVLCADRLRYHVALAKLGKTPLGKEERILLPLNPAEMPLQPHHVPNKIFLYEVSQLTNTQQSKDVWFWSDLSNALELPFQIHPQNVTTIKPGKKAVPTAQQNIRNKLKMDVCNPKNDKLREILMTYARQSADWICPYFLQEGSGVMVSDKEHFCGNIMQSWRQDPCRSTNSSQS